MAYQKRKPKYRPWREFLTDDELARVAEIEASSRPSAQMKLDLVTIRARASQRAMRDARSKECGA